MTIILGDPQDTYHSAQLFLKIHGARAEHMALAQMMEMIQQNDIHAAGHWLSIANGIDELKQLKARGTVH